MGTARVQANGTVTIPQAIRKGEKLKEGDVLSFIGLGDGQILVKRPTSKEETIEQLKRVW